jgi:integrase
MTALELHLAEHVEADPEALLFTASNGGPLRRTKFRDRWLRACVKAGVTGLHFHDLRGSGATLAATSGATIAELMHRLGHKSATAAMRYQHATVERDRALADLMGKAIADAQPEPTAEVASIS